MYGKVGGYSVVQSVQPPPFLELSILLNGPRGQYVLVAKGRIHYVRFLITILKCLIPILCVLVEDVGKIKYQCGASIIFPTCFLFNNN